MVRDLLPSLVDEMKRALTECDEVEVADRLDSLKAWGRCACGDDFCSSFYTGPQPTGKWGDEGDCWTIPLIVATGIVNLDVVSGMIRYVEVIDRPEVDAIVRRLPALPKSQPATT